MSAVRTRRCFNLDEYHRMGEAGILRSDERLELIEGEIITMAPIGSRRMACILRLDRAFHRGLQDAALVSVQNPVRLSPHVEPQPDIALLRHRPDLYASGLPGPNDALLVIEVSDTALAYDRDVKLPLYAAAGIPEAWLTDLNHDQLQVHREPSDGRYQQVTVYGRGAAISPLVLPTISLRVDDILG